VDDYNTLYIDLSFYMCLIIISIMWLNISSPDMPKPWKPDRTTRESGKPAVTWQLRFRTMIHFCVSLIEYQSKVRLVLGLFQHQVEIGRLLYVV